MKVKLSDVLNSVEVMRNLAQENVSAVVSFRIAKAIKAINEEIDMFEAEKAKLVQKYGEPHDGGVRVADDKQDDFQKEINRLLSEKVELAATPIKLKDLEHVQLKPIDMMTVDFLIEE